MRFVTPLPTTINATDAVLQSITSDFLHDTRTIVCAAHNIVRSLSVEHKMFQICYEFI